MRILYDHQIFSHQMYGGISRYFSELFRQLASEGDVRYSLPILFSNNAYLPGNPAFKGWPLLPRARFKGKNRALHLLNRSISSLALASGHYDVFHPTYFDPYFLPLLRGRPFVLTIYDMIHELFPGNYSPDNPDAARKRMLALRASRIIAISETTKQDIVRFYGIPEERIKVIHLCDSFTGGPGAVPSRRPLPRYFLFVGKRQGYKNFAGTVTALAPLFREDPSLHLVFTGGDRLTPEEIQSLEGLGGPERWAWKNVSDPELESLYCGALALIFPSIYEGFGIPILEAFRCGCPVLLSRASCFPEIAGDAALYFDPADPADFEAKLRFLTEDAGLRQDLVRRGLERVRDFSWKQCAEDTLAVYREIMGR